MLYGTTLLTELDAAGVRYCHWKSNQHLAEGLAGTTDLDILVDESDYDTLHITLRRLRCIQAMSPEWAAYPHVEDWIAHDDGSGTTLHLHIHFKMITGLRFSKETILPWESLALKTRVRDTGTGIWIINPYIEFAVLGVRVGIKTSFRQMLTSLFKPNPSLLPDTMGAEVQYIANQIQLSELKETCLKLFGITLGDSFFILLAALKEEVSLLTILKIKWFWFWHLGKWRRHSIKRALMLYTLNTLRIRINTAVHRLGFEQQRTKKTLIAERGSIIAIIGSDGAGKSTLVENLHSWLNWKLAVSHVYLGRHWLFRVLEKIKVSISVTPNRLQESETPNEPQPPSQRGLRLCIADIRKALNAWGRRRNIKKALIYRNTGYIVLTDRFPQNQGRAINDGPSINPDDSSFFLHQWCYRYEQQAYNEMCEVEPDMVIKLFVTEATAMERKPDHRADNIRKKIALIDTLTFGSAPIKTIDTTQHSIDDVLGAAQRIIWDYLSSYAHNK